MLNRFHISFSVLKLLLSSPLTALYGERTRMRHLTFVQVRQAKTQAKSVR